MNGFPTSECSGDENRCESSDSSNERGITYEPIVATNVFVFDVAPAVDGNPEEDEDL